jgi:hypothetical protein
MVVSYRGENRVKHPFWIAEKQDDARNRLGRGKKGCGTGTLNLEL